MNGLTMSQKFYVTDGLNRNFILGRDWLKQNGIRMYFDLGMLRIGRTYVKFEEDCHIASILRLNRKIIIKPQSAMICHVRLNQGFQLPNSKVIEFTPLNECINDEPGLHIRESINTSKKSYKDSDYDYKRNQPILPSKERQCRRKSQTPVPQCKSAVLSQWTWTKVKTPMMISKR